MPTTSDISSPYRTIYARLRDGGWGVRVFLQRPEPGQEVEVFTKTGEVHHRVIERILKREKSNKYALPCYLCSIQRGTPVG